MPKKTPNNALIIIITLLVYLPPPEWELLDDRQYFLITPVSPTPREFIFWLTSACCLLKEASPAAPILSSFSIRELPKYWLGTNPILLREALSYQRRHDKILHLVSLPLPLPSLSPTVASMGSLHKHMCSKESLLLIQPVGTCILSPVPISPPWAGSLSLIVLLSSVLWLAPVVAWLWDELRSWRPSRERISTRIHLWTEFPYFMANVNTGKYIIIKHYYHF